jgi:branched-chain amino acid transport system permease protein
MQGMRIWQPLVAIGVAGLLLAFILPQVAGPYYLHVVDVTLINVIMALGLNLVLGFGGQISLAQAAFFGIGAYSFAILQAHSWPVPAAAAAAVTTTGLIGALLGWPVLRLRGHYLALATLAFGLITSELMVNLDMLTGGSNGMMGIVGIGLSGDNEAMLNILLLVAGVALAASVVFAYSPMGLRVRAFRDDITAAQAAGINVRALKIGLFVASAVYGGTAGVCYCCLLGYVSPDVFAWQTTFSYLAMVVVGGLGSSLGAVIGAALYTLVPEWLRFLQEAYFAIFGTFVIVVIALIPGGLAGLSARLLRSVWPSRAAAPAPRAPLPEVAP